MTALPGIRVKEGEGAWFLYAYFEVRNMATRARDEWEVVLFIHSQAEKYMGLVSHKSVTARAAG